VMPRHVAYILANLADGERELVPWHRLVADRGKVGGANPAKAAEQIERFAEEAARCAPPSWWASNASSRPRGRGEGSGAL
jgi:alkylated DNA nucleotide flippase Atl1